MRNFADGAGQLGDQFADFFGIGFGADGALEGFLEFGRGDHLHRLGDFLDVSDRLAAFDDRACLGHRGGIGIKTGATVKAAWR